eukprot:CAMPEP_0195530000 /NCGR_PEP_ID=MMETSP0794_2-20130614/32698_1 /TAXON_ID=515487 /ORGANISM="Stephanopyxis turris, Strain CCMP 815" /LENGTH=657 /DNA_ID=CAMNT_0040661395 /DNA_START=68 /DNA_END=2041 /DNA_ORIENTATION=+
MSAPVSMYVIAGAFAFVFLFFGVSVTTWNRNTKEIKDLREQMDALMAEVQVLPSSPQQDDRPRNLEALTCGCADSFTYASDFGLVGDGVTNDAVSLQKAIDSAASNLDAGGTVILPKGTFLTLSSLNVPAGVTIKGQGYGSSPLAIEFDAGGSTIAYCGTDYAVKMTGHAASLQDLAVYDWRYPINTYCDTVKAAGGVLIEADKKLVESVTISNVFLYWFMGGTSLTLEAKNQGGIAYSNFQNIRVRHSKVGIKITADANSFVNSNSFLGGAVSGDIENVGVLAEGPGACNDNKFYGMVIEPPHTNLAHVYVTGTKTNVKLLDVRLEGTDMYALDKPLVVIDDSSYGNVMNGMLGHTHVKADLNRNPGIDFVSNKMAGLDPAPMNMLWNAAFNGYDKTTETLPGWKNPGSNVHLDVLSESEVLYADHQILRVDYLNFGGAFKLEPSTLPKSPAHSMVSFGIYARSSVANSISAVMRYTSGSIISSASHSGSDEWEFIGMSSLYDKSAPYFYFSITGDVDVTAPTLVYGFTPATPGASLMSSSGARMSGTFTMGMVIAYPPPSNTPYYWVLPLNEGNIFEMDMQGNPYRTIIRLNHKTADRFDKGTVVTLLFAEVGTKIRHNAYIKLKGGMDFVSTENSSITLVSNGDPTWTEVSRND